ncbi:MAG: D-glycero-alpha-D-manno-heptose-1,7-bisphosphate 7-phosphatase [Candidatus Kryptoniota bacterium]
MIRALFVDRDGTINFEKDFIRDPDQLELIDGSAEAIAMANRMNLKVIVISNQSGVARGIMTIDEVERVNYRLKELLSQNGAKVDAMYYCPHHPDYTSHIICSCRKPDIGMLLRAEADFGINLKKSFVVGDKWSDVKCGANAGAFTSLVLTGYGQVEHQRCVEDAIKIDYLARNLYDAVTNFVKGKVESGE